MTTTWRTTRRLCHDCSPSPRSRRRRRRRRIGGPRKVRRPWPESRESTDGGRSLLDELMIARQVADLLQMRISTVASARRGLLPSVKVGRHRRFIRSQLERALAALTDRGVPDPGDRSDDDGHSALASDLGAVSAAGLG